MIIWPIATVRLATFCLLLSVMPGYAQPAWWLTARFEPADDAVHSIPVSELDRTWVKASVLSKANLPARAADPNESVESHDGAFSVTTDLDNDGRAETALVGVYRERSGETGRFLLILSPSANRGWTKRELFKRKGEAGFSVLFLQDDHLSWAECMECDTFCEVVRSGRSFTLKCSSCCDQP